MGKHLTIKERYYIEISLKKKIPVKQIAKDLGYSKQAIYAEIKKGSCTQVDTHLREHKVYLSDYAQRQHDQKETHKGRKKLLGQKDPYLQQIAYWIKERKYSPYAANIKAGSTLCEKTIYNYVHAGYIPGLTVCHLPYARPKKKRFSKRINPYTKGQSIDQRPAHINDRSVYGHWEGDTVYSSKDDFTCLLTLTERKTREEIAIRIPDRTAASVLHAFDRLEHQLGTTSFRMKFKSITFDNGAEFSLWEKIETCSRSRAKRTTVYFAHPYRSGERGTNENHNRMIRRWNPKGDDIGLYSPAEISDIVDWINTYPRRMFGGRSSSEICSCL